MAKEWKSYLLTCPDIRALEQKLSPTLVENKSGMKSTANTDVEKRIISVDVSQPPLKCALSYAYELMNLNNSEAYQHLNTKASLGSISKSSYVIEILKLESSACYFRASVFRQLHFNDNECPFDTKYLRLFDETAHLSKQDQLDAFFFEMKETGIVRRQYAAKKYYADSYCFFSHKAGWPEEYNAPRDASVTICGGPSR